jgi:dihydrolipoamide dehydrogenase
VADDFDAIVVGMGPGGEVVASRLLAAGQRVAVVERDLIGGECAYWACIPSKTVLRASTIAAAADRFPGTSGTRLEWHAVRDYRDLMARHLDDTAQVRGYARQGATVIKGTARIAGPRRVRVDDREITAPHTIIATGSASYVPQIEGLDDVTVWTNRETFTATELPRRAIVIGGSAVGIETSLFLARFGVAVTLVQRSARLLGREEPRVGELVEEHLQAVGVEVRTGITPQAARTDNGTSVLELDDGTEVRGDVIIFGTGRSPRTGDLGLEHAGVVVDDRGAIVVDERCRAADGTWAIGDVTGIMPFTHVAKYQARVVADCILGRTRVTRYEGIPRVVFSDPEIAAVGLTTAGAGERGIATTSATVDLPETIARPWTYEREPRGELGLLVNTTTDVLVGAWAVAPLAGEWIHQAALAIRVGIPIDTLLDQVAQFPSYTEGYLNALEALPRRGPRSAVSTNAPSRMPSASP